MGPGQMIQFAVPGGGVMQAAIPQGVQAGGTFLVEVPAPIATAQAICAPPGPSQVPMEPYPGSSQVPTGPPPAAKQVPMEPASSSVPMGLPVQQPAPSSIGAPPGRGPPVR